jgi:periplasmic copper chaperone A
MRSKTAMFVAAGALALPASAGAHVTLQPDAVPAGGFARVDVRVPNERDDKGTTKVAVRMPPGFIFASSEPVAGWKVNIKKRKLDKPVKEHGESYDEEVDVITWTGDGQEGIVRPGEFQDFGLSVGVPDGKAGSKLTFKATQTYEGGEVVRWIGPPNADQPAPEVTLLASEEEGSHGANEQAAAGDTVSAEPASATTGGDDDEGPSTGLVIAALALGALGLVVGSAGLVTARRRST